MYNYFEVFWEGVTMVSVIYSAALHGIDAFIVTVEASRGGRSQSLSGSSELRIIGLPDTAVKESGSRVRSAITSGGFRLFNGMLTVNLAPADKKKEGSGFDLPIFLSLIKEDALQNLDLDGKCFVGELSLTGALRPIRGALSMAIEARNAGFKEIYVPFENAKEASAAIGIDVFPVSNVIELYEHLLGIVSIPKQEFSIDDFTAESLGNLLDYSDVKGQDKAKKALEVAAAGAHNLLMIGPPGSGKSMLASRLPSILPPQTLEEAIETTKIHSIAGVLSADTPLLFTKPFRSPHHSMSAAGLAGGGKTPTPGEISLSHNGVLFLDELPEFDKNTMEILRQPLEDGKVTITRVNGKVTFPSDFMLVCAMNPCKCGYYGSPNHECTCSPASRHSYLSKISGPLLDRIDIQIEVPALDFDKLSANRPSESSSEIRKRVIAAREFAKARFESGNDGILANSQMGQAQIRKYCVPDDAGKALLKTAYDKLGLSARGYDRILRLSRTLADIDRSDDIKKGHILGAIQLRSLDKSYWS